MDTALVLANQILADCQEHGDKIPETRPIIMSLSQYTLCFLKGGTQIHKNSVSSDELISRIKWER